MVKGTSCSRVADIFFQTEVFFEVWKSESQTGTISDEKEKISLHAKSGEDWCNPGVRSVAGAEEKSQSPADIWVSWIGAGDENGEQLPELHAFFFVSRRRQSSGKS
ncbi:hypothetical protein U1Q18_022658 [Sarracenia purpurea var. burkii]